MGPNWTVRRKQLHRNDLQEFSATARIRTGAPE
jgi:hypothetical protein